MNLKFLGIFFAICLIASFSFADASITGISPNPTILNETDSNLYFNMPLTLSTLVSEGDVNSDSLCWAVAINDGDTNTYLADWNSDTNTCTAVYNDESRTNDFNFQLIVQTASLDANYETPTVLYYLDSTAPTTTPNDPTAYPGYVILTVVDEATTTGLGSDFQLTYYWIDGGARQTSLVNPTTFSIGSAGSHTIQWCSVDQLDNNECTQSEIYSKIVTIGGNTSGTYCSMFSLFPLLFVFAAFFGGTGIFALSQSKQGNWQILVGYAITLILGVVILINILPVLC